MATTLTTGFIYGTASKDAEGHREYKVKCYVRGDTTDGPANVLQTPGLPFVGSPWIFDNDIDIWAWCQPTCTVTPRDDSGKTQEWELEFTYSTKPPGNGKQRCQDTPIEDPLLEPNKITGGFNDITREATYDRNGNPIVNSAFERLRGPQTEFDEGRPTIVIEQNVYPLGIETFAPMTKRVNEAALWGFNPRCIKLNKVTWEEKYQGSCNKYFTRKLEFEIDPLTFDRDILDEGTKVLNGHWDPDTGYWTLDYINGVIPNYLNPSHYIKAVDYQGNPMKIVLNGRGVPAEATVVGTGALGTGTYETLTGSIHVEKHLEANFLLLGIPLVIGY